MVAVRLELTQPHALTRPASHPLEFDSHRCSPWMYVEQVVMCVGRFHRALTFAGSLG